MLTRKTARALTLFLLLGSTPALSEQQTIPTPKSTEVLKSSTSWTGQKIAYPQTDKPLISAYVVEFAPGAKTTWHMHPVPEYLHVLEGTLMIEDERGNKRQFRAGEGFIEVIDNHQGSNPGTTPTKILAVFIGAEGTPVRVDRPTQ